MFRLANAPDRSPPPKSHQDDFDIVKAYQTLATLRPMILLLDVAYILFVWKGAQYLSNLKPKKGLIRDLSIVWNGFNALTSMSMFVSLLPEFLTSISNGYYYTICNQGTFYSGKYSGYAMYLFCLSKIWELGDTVLLALRGRPIIFLHFFHHAIVIVQVCFTYYTAGSMARLGTVMNSFVHSIMYSYFVIQNFEPRIRQVASIITILQMLQFVVACTGMVSLTFYVFRGNHCDTQYSAIGIHFTIYTAFLVLFLKFFYDSYIADKKQNSEHSSKTKLHSN